MATDYYHVAQQLADTLRAQGEALRDAADDLEEALYGATPTERLMGIRFNLSRTLADNRLLLSEEWRTAASELVASIEVALRQ